MPEIHAKESELVVLGNGSAQQAAWFVESTGMTTPVFTDPQREAYRIVGARRGLRSVLHPKVALRTLQAWSRGYRQSASGGDATQLGGVFILMPDGSMPYAHLSAYAGDAPQPQKILQALRHVAAATSP